MWEGRLVVSEAVVASGQFVVGGRQRHRGRRTGAKRLSLLAASIALFAQAAAATPLTLVADDRQIYQSDAILPFPASPPFSHFNSTTYGFEANAGQDSTVSQSAMSGSVTTYASGFSYSSSTFDITFDADISVSYQLSGSRFVDASVVDVSLLDVTTATVVFQPSSSSGPFSDSGTLTAGHRYRLLVEAASLGQGDFSWASGYAEFDFSVVAVPEPSTAGLIGFGLLALAAGRRRG